MAAKIHRRVVRDRRPKAGNLQKKLLVAGVVMMLAGAASPGHAAAPAPGLANDPFEHLNRRGFAFQMAFTRHGLGFIGVIFRALTPGPIGKAFHNILVNLSEPVVIINDMLQLRPARAGGAAIRLAVNSTVGLAGMIDVTGATGLPHRPSSFGDTLGRYGVGPGPYLFIPVIGPSTVRDLFGNIVDAAIDPLHFVQYPYRQQVSVAVGVGGGLDQWIRSEADLRTLLSTAADPYATLRSTYLQHRQGEISGQTVVPVVLPDLDDPAAPPAAPPAGPSAASDLGAGQSAVPGAPGEEAAALQPLPDGQDRHADGQFAGALDQRQGDGHVGAEAKQGAKDGVAGLLNADAHGGDEGGAAQGHDQGLETQNLQGADGDPGDD
jgi:phospholipid-binding lipoprotein MlaA